MTDAFDLSHLTPEQQEAAQQQIQAAIDAGRVFTNRDQDAPKKDDS